MADEKAEVATPAVVSGAPTEVVVTGTPVASGQPSEEGKALTERMNAIENQRFQGPPNNLVDRISDSGVQYYDDNLANKRYFAKLKPGEKMTPIGTPTGQLNVLQFPGPENGNLEGRLVMREDGTFYSIPPGTTSIGDVVDPDSGDRLIGDVDKKRQKAREEAAANVPLRHGDTVPVAEPKKAAAKGKGKGK